MQIFRYTISISMAAWLLEFIAYNAEGLKKASVLVILWFHANGLDFAAFQGGYGNTKALYRTNMVMDF